MGAGHGAGSEAVIRIYGSVELEQKEILTAPQYCIEQYYHWFYIYLIPGDIQRLPTTNLLFSVAQGIF
jgi:hypothetical protein